MSLSVSKVSGCTTLRHRANITESCTTINSFVKPIQYSASYATYQRIYSRRHNYGHGFGAKRTLSSEGLWHKCTKPCTSTNTREHSVQCQSTGTHNTEAKECARHSDDCSDASASRVSFHLLFLAKAGAVTTPTHPFLKHRLFKNGTGPLKLVLNKKYLTFNKVQRNTINRAQLGSDEVETSFDALLPGDPVMPHNTYTYSSQGLAHICKYVYNDAKYVNERARHDIVLLSRGIMKLNDRACQDVAVLGSEFLKLDARVREDTVKIDHGVKRKAEHLHHIATILKDKAQSKLRTAADKHWNDGALEADLRRADLLAKRRAMKDAFMALEFVKNVHDMMVSNLYKGPLYRKDGSSSADESTGIMLEKNGEMIDFLHGKVSADRITAIQEVYLSMASALSEADGIDYTNPEELELLVSTLIDLDAMDGKSSVSLLAECSISPDVNTRKALANALASAPSMWTLGNAGMGALQRLAKDSNPAIAAAATKTINELKKQWEIEEGDNWRFTMNQTPSEEIDENSDVETE